MIMITKSNEFKMGLKIYHLAPIIVITVTVFAICEFNKRDRDEDNNKGFTNYPVERLERQYAAENALDNKTHPQELEDTLVRTIMANQSLGTASHYTRSKRRRRQAQAEGSDHATFCEMETKEHPCNVDPNVEIKSLRDEMSQSDIDNIDTKTSNHLESHPSESSSVPCSGPGCMKSKSTINYHKVTIVSKNNSETDMIINMKDDQSSQDMKIVEEMEKHPSSRLDVTNAENAHKEYGNNLGKIALASAMTNEDINKVTNQVDNMGRQEKENDLSNTDLHKESETLKRLLVNESEAESSNNRIGTLNSQEESIILDLQSLLNEESSRIHDSHEEHRQDLIHSIENLKLSNDSSVDHKLLDDVLNLVYEMEQDHEVNDIFDSHHDGLNLEEEFENISEMDSDGESDDEVESYHSTEKSEDEKSAEVQEVEVYNGPSKIKVDELAVKDAEMNFNGGYHQDVDTLKVKYPEGRWPDSDNQLISQGTNTQNGYQNVDTGNYQSYEDSEVPNDEGDQNSQQLFNYSISDGSEDANIDNNDYNVDNFNHQGHKEVRSLKDDIMDLENSNRENKIRGILNKGPVQANFVDFDQLSEEEKLNEIIREQKNGAKQSLQVHHVQEHDVDAEVQ